MIRPGLALILAVAVLASGLLAARTAEEARREEILVFAAASLANVLAEAARDYRKAGGGEVAFNFASSSDLARQIEAGAPAHAFLSANREQVARLERRGLVPPSGAFPLAANTLAVIVPAASRVQRLARPRDLLRFDRLAVADPASVPAGIYARGWLEREGLWREVEPRVLPALDVRAAVAAVAAGNAPAGVVYSTDVVSSGRVRVVYRVPRDATPDLLYWAAPVGGEKKGGAARFLEFLRGARGQALFARYGFLRPGS